MRRPACLAFLASIFDSRGVKESTRRINLQSRNHPRISEGRILKIWKSQQRWESVRKGPRHRATALAF